jgi:hypothetical protein
MKDATTAAGTLIHCQHYLYRFNGRKKAQKAQNYNGAMVNFMYPCFPFLLRLLRFFAAIIIGCGRRPRQVFRSFILFLPAGCQSPLYF